MLKHNVRVKMLSNPKYFELTVSITHLVFQRNVKVSLLVYIPNWILHSNIHLKRKTSRKELHGN